MHRLRLGSANDPVAHIHGMRGGHRRVLCRTGLGRRKLAPRVSPGKTWEGAAGGMAAVALAAWAGAAYFDLPILGAIAFGCLMGIFSMVGDLTESMFKRAAALKDSGALLPGHGGMLDRLDSVTAAAPLYALGLFGSGVIR